MTRLATYLEAFTSPRKHHDAITGSESDQVYLDLPTLRDFRDSQRRNACVSA